MTETKRPEVEMYQKHCEKCQRPFPVILLKDEEPPTLCSSCRPRLKEGEQVTMGVDLSNEGDRSAFLLHSPDGTVEEITKEEYDEKAKDPRVCVCGGQVSRIGDDLDQVPGCVCGGAEFTTVRDPSGEVGVSVGGKTIPCQSCGVLLENTGPVIGKGPLCQDCLVGKLGEDSRPDEDLGKCDECGEHGQEVIWCDLGRGKRWACVACVEAWGPGKEESNDHTYNRKFGTVKYKVPQPEQPIEIDGTIDLAELEEEHFGLCCGNCGEGDDMCPTCRKKTEQHREVMAEEADKRIDTGIPELDAVLSEGLPKEKLVGPFQLRPEQEEALDKALQKEAPINFPMSYSAAKCNSLLNPEAVQTGRMQSKEPNEAAKPRSIEEDVQKALDRGELTPEMVEDGTRRIIEARNVGSQTECEVSGHLHIPYPVTKLKGFYASNSGVNEAAVEEYDWKTIFPLVKVDHVQAATEYYQTGESGELIPCTDIHYAMWLQHANAEIGDAYDQVEGIEQVELFCGRCRQSLGMLSPNPVPPIWCRTCHAVTHEFMRKEDLPGEMLVMGGETRKTEDPLKETQLEEWSRKLREARNGGEPCKIENLPIDIAATIMRLHDGGTGEDAAKDRDWTLRRRFRPRKFDNWYTAFGPDGEEDKLEITDESYQELSTMVVGYPMLYDVLLVPESTWHQWCQDQKEPRKEPQPNDNKRTLPCIKCGKAYPVASPDTIEVTCPACARSESLAKHLKEGHVFAERRFDPRAMEDMDKEDIPDDEIWRMFFPVGSEDKDGTTVYTKTLYGEDVPISRNEYQALVQTSNLWAEKNKLEKHRDNLVQVLVKLFGWRDQSYVHATLHVENAVGNLRADLATAKAELDKAIDRAEAAEQIMEETSSRDTGYINTLTKDAGECEQGLRDKLACVYREWGEVQERLEKARRQRDKWHSRYDDNLDELRLAKQRADLEQTRKTVLAEKVRKQSVEILGLQNQISQMSGLQKDTNKRWEERCDDAAQANAELCDDNVKLHARAVGAEQANGELVHKNKELKGSCAWYVECGNELRKVGDELRSKHDEIEDKLKTILAERNSFKMELDQYKSEPIAPKLYTCTHCGGHFAEPQCRICGNVGPGKESDDARMPKPQEWVQKEEFLHPKMDAHEAMKKKGLIFCRGCRSFMRYFCYTAGDGYQCHECAGKPWYDCAAKVCSDCAHLLNVQSFNEGSMLCKTCESREKGQEVVELSSGYQPRQCPWCLRYLSPIIDFYEGDTNCKVCTDSKKGDSK